MTAQVPALTILFCTVSCILAFAVPIALLLFLRIKKHADILPFFIGCAVMLIFALILESIVHNIVFNSASGRKIQDSIWLYALYGGMMAGIFEETGRFTAFKTVLRKKNSNDANALMYGAGHGGFEAIVLLGFSMISNIATAVMINSGRIGELTAMLPEESLAQVRSVIDQLVSSSPYLFIAGIIERIFAIALHIALSVFVWFAAKNRKKLLLWPAAIIIHAAVDGIMVIVSRYSSSVVITEASIAIMTLLAVFGAVRVWRSNSVPSASEEVLQSD